LPLDKTESENELDRTLTSLDQFSPLKSHVDIYTR